MSDDLKEKMNKIGKFLDGQFNKGLDKPEWGFVMIVFPLDFTAHSLVSNVSIKSDIGRMLKQALHKLRQGVSFSLDH